MPPGEIIAAICVLYVMVCALLLVAGLCRVAGDADDQSEAIARSLGIDTDGE